MTLVKTIVTETGSGSPPVHEYVPLEAKYKTEGVKKPDTLTAKFPIQAKIREGYNIKYIQDIVDVSYLSAIYPMQLTCLDEGGYDQDPTTDPDETRFEKVTTGRFKGMYALNFNADGQGVAITTTNRINLSKQFDIYIYFTPNQTQLVDGLDEPILWSFRDSSTPRGLEIGISGNNVTPSSWRVFLRVSNGFITNGYTGSSQTIMNGANVPVLIRVKRGQDNLIKAYVNGVEDISQSETASLQPTGTNMIFGDTPSSTNDEYSGLIHQVRVYSGVDLTDDQHKIIRWSKPQPAIMKFAGRIWKTNNKQSNKTIHAQSNSLALIKTKLGEDGVSLNKNDLSEVQISFTGGSGNLDIGNVVRGNTSGAGGTYAELISGTEAAGTIRLTVRSSASYVAGETLSEEGATTDWTATFTGGSEVKTPYKTHVQNAINNIFNVSYTVKAKDSFDYIQGTDAPFNRMKGNLIQIGSFLDFLTVLMEISKTIFYTTPRGLLIVESNSGHATDHIFDQNGSTLKYKITDSEENDTTLVNEVVLTGAGGIKIRRVFSPNDIRRTLRKNYSQIDNINDLDNFATRLRTVLSGVPELDSNPVAKSKHVITIQFPINHVRTNQIVNIKRKNGQNSALGGTDEDLNVNEKVTSIEVSYPGGKTRITTGENDIDYFDDVQIETEVRDGLVDNTL